MLANLGIENSPYVYSVAFNSTGTLLANTSDEGGPHLAGFFFGAPHPPG